MGVSFTPFSALGASLAAASPIATLARGRVHIVVDGESYLVSLANSVELVVARLDRSGAELARATVPLPLGALGGHMLHVADGFVYVVHAAVRDDLVQSLAVSAFDADLTFLPERSGPLFDGSAAFQPTIARDPMTGTHAIAYRVPSGAVELRRFSHRPE